MQNFAPKLVGLFFQTDYISLNASPVMQHIDFIWQCGDKGPFLLILRIIDEQIDHTWENL